MKAFLPALVLLLPLAGFGQSSEKAITQQFFELYRTNTDQAFDYLFSTNPWFAPDNAGVQNVKAQIRENVVAVMGAYYGYELVAEAPWGRT